ncbi:hypothetical protein PVAND_008319 [Polypedilum vanderplanki]|uniref:Chitin-binding type-2 domain-containing protein n=1 Tax=Polypedilum vanderplanki TaxID=319348 RepID=A0A9J6C9E0_POLVA|nr:hypothetical protein PVAND_008319 [Polypedilum vanderplanki]
MNKYKRWILILTALTVFVVHVESLRATSLIHAGKFTKLLNATNNSNNNNSTTTSSTTEGSADRLRAILDELPDDDDGVIDVNGTKITLTGIPQIDYVWDPNLPRELNGYNLSTYPFLDSMPAEEDIGFDCDDKINGFYASIKYSCQLYHHCLYGVRSDFICANFTAFDQKTFICHFVSEVDCKNSYKYWNRNDDLYKATTTTTTSTLMPLIDRSFYNRTRHSFLNGGSNSNNAGTSSVTSTQNNSQQQNSDSNSSNLSNNSKNNNNSPPAQTNNNNGDDFYNGSNRPQRPPMRRPPYRRRRPPVDYYYYDDDYEDEVYDDRGRRRNRPRNRRPIYDDYDNRRPDNRRPYYDDFDDYEYERRPLRNRNRPESRNGSNDERRRYEDRRRRPAYDDERERRPIDERERRPVDDRRRTTERKPQQQEERRYNNEERKFPDDDRVYARRNPLADDKRNKAPQELKQNTEEVKSAGSIFDRVRPPPKINRPVPLSEKSKFAYKNKDKSEDYEEYDEVPVSSSTTTIKPTTTSTPKAFSFPKPTKFTTTTTTTTETALTAEIEYYDDEYYDTVTQQQPIESSSIKAKPNVVTTTTVTSIPDSFRLNRYKNDNSKENQQQQQQTFIEPTTKKPLPSIISTVNGAGNKKYANKQTVFEPVTQETLTPVQKAPSAQGHFQNLYNSRNLEKQDVEPTAVDEKEQKPSVRVVKRPFLPSRGGNPYSARKLQPVGTLAEQQNQDDSQGIDVRQTSDTAKRITLENLYEEYDVDLNDALNPMLKPLTSSRNVNSNSYDASDNDRYKSQSQKIIHKADHFISPKASTVATTTSTTAPPQAEYYDDELEYTYADDVA